MKKVILLALLAFAFKQGAAQGPNYFSAADSCLKLKNYVCAATNYELYLKTDPESNGVAYMLAKAWAMAKVKDKTFAALTLYVKNNALNNSPFFSDKLLTEKSFDFLKDDPRWQAMIASVQKGEAMVREQERKDMDAVKVNWRRFEAGLNVRPQLDRLTMSGDVYRQLKTMLIYKSPKPYLTGNGITLFIRVNNQDIPFYVHIPENYDPAVACPALVVLHGGVKYIKGYGDAASFPTIYRATSDHIPGYSKKYITIYPIGTATLNWMNTEAGFDMVNQIVLYIKGYLNIDDNRVELLGHSNGATGVFTYLVKSPSLYAGFYGMNTQPKVFIGGTFLRNGSSRHFYNFTTDKDYYYPYAAVKTIDSLANSLGVNWHTDVNKGYPHWFPAMKESLEPMAKIFKDMETRVRNPYPNAIYFETDHIKYGASDWISITGLDTLSDKASWQIDPNFKITDWLDNNDFNKIIHRKEMSFDYPHRSGAVKATCIDNVFTVETSAIRAFRILLSPEMVDLNKPVSVIVNGKLYSRKVKNYDKDFMISNFKTTLDRSAIWVNYIDVSLP